MTWLSSVLHTHGLAWICLRVERKYWQSSNPGLGIGWGYFVPKDPYDEFVLNHTSDDDISICVSFAVLMKQDTKFSMGMRYTGIGTVSLLSLFAELLLVIISYDIVCQWFINLDNHMKDWPSELGTVPENMILTPAILKFHELVHKQENHQEFSCNLIKGMGLLDCEVPEWIWGPNNPLSNLTKTMGPRSQQDVLDNNFGMWNWQKYTGMGFPEHLVTEWEKICVEWEDAGFLKMMVETPFTINQEYMSEEEVEKELEAEEEEHCRQGRRVLHAMSAYKFVILGLALEESQQMNVMKGAGVSKTTQESNYIILKEKLQSWLVLHAIYIPGLVQYLTEIGEPCSYDDENAEDVRLWLPSNLPSNQRSTFGEVGAVWTWRVGGDIADPRNKDIRSYMDIDAKKLVPGQQGNNEDDDEPTYASKDEEEDELSLETEE
ncbi:hypothetical protein ARMGADRAFT_1038012 [Armillaria gallica]|uniref:Uncharacterized protein n=1 Tax=Armillaria gallica TaxID=47427 RepID=A0A2H3CJE8_ARMGA|nr:hypothetical protein ARMGADRAFT_1038012 [Armillaria gallica]